MNFTTEDPPSFSTATQHMNVFLYIGMCVSEYVYESMYMYVGVYTDEEMVCRHADMIWETAIGKEGSPTIDQL